MNAMLLTFVFAPKSLDVWVGIGGLVAIALALVWWARRERAANPESLDASEGES